MQERDIRLLFSAGHWNSALVVPNKSEDGWQVVLLSKSEDDPAEILSSKRGGARIFKTSDAALVWCQQIGFESVKVHLVPPNYTYPTNVKNMQMNCSILLVEDNEDDIQLTRYAINKHKITNELVIKRDGAEALKYLYDETTSPEGLPCIIILDLHLPKVSGLDVLKKIRSHESTKSIPVVILSTSDLNTDIQKSYQLGSNSYICKPNDIDQFSDAIKRLGAYWTELNLLPS